MSNFPSKWFDFANYKELKRLRNDVKDTFSLKIQIAASIIVAIMSFFLDGYIKEMCGKMQILFCFLICATVILIFILPSIYRFISLRVRSNVLIKGKDAVSVFDDEIVYNVLVACEYYNSKSTIPDTVLKSELESFYTLEISYYITESIKMLSLFSANCGGIFGDGENKISKQRVDNIVGLINELVTSNGVSLDRSTRDSYEVFCKMINSNF